MAVLFKDALVPLSISGPPPSWSNNDRVLDQLVRTHEAILDRRFRFKLGFEQEFQIYPIKDSVPTDADAQALFTERRASLGSKVSDSPSWQAALGAARDIGDLVYLEAAHHTFGASHRPGTNFRDVHGPYEAALPAADAPQALEEYHRYILSLKKTAAAHRMNVSFQKMDMSFSLRSTVGLFNQSEPTPPDLAERVADGVCMVVNEATPVFLRPFMFERLNVPLINIGVTRSHAIRHDGGDRMELRFNQNPTTAYPAVMALLVGAGALGGLNHDIGELYAGKEYSPTRYVVKRMCIPDEPHAMFLAELLNVARIHQDGALQVEHQNHLYKSVYYYNNMQAALLQRDLGIAMTCAPSRIEQWINGCRVKDDKIVAPDPDLVSREPEKLMRALESIHVSAPRRLLENPGYELTMMPSNNMGKHLAAHYLGKMTDSPILNAALPRDMIEEIAVAETKRLEERLDRNRGASRAKDDA